MRVKKRSVQALFFLVVCAGFMTGACSGAGCPPPLCPFENLTGSTGCLCPFTGETSAAGCPPPLCPFESDASGPCLPNLCPFGDGSVAGITMEGTTSMMLADFSASPTTGMAPLTVTFNDLSGGFPTAWQWDFGDGKTSNKQNPVHTYLQPGTYSVTLKVSRGSDSTGVRWGSSSSQTKDGFVVVNGNGQPATVSSVGSADGVATFQTQSGLPLKPSVFYSGAELIKGLQVSEGLYEPGSISGNWQSFSVKVSGHLPLPPTISGTGVIITEYHVPIGPVTAFDLLSRQQESNNSNAAGYLAAIRSAGA